MRRRFHIRAAVHVLSLVVAAFCVLAQLAGAAHFLLVSHTVCLEHGEIVHGKQTSGVALHASSQKESVGTTVDAADDVDDDHGHDHCVLPSHRVDGAKAVAAVGIVAPRPASPTLEMAVPAERAAIVQPRSRMLLLAPKSSPPRTPDV